MKLANQNLSNKKRKGNDGSEIFVINDAPLTEEEFLKFKILHTTGEINFILLNKIYLYLFITF